jgi:polysaccharide pyruvyl transferase WcaK-like protein
MSLSVIFNGAGPTTSNLGVSALYATMVAGVHRRFPDAELNVIDMLLGRRTFSQLLDDGDPIEVNFLGARSGWRLNVQENLLQAKVAARLGRLGGRINALVKTVGQAVCMLDVSGGDSFTDMYPDRRIRLIAGPKELALSLGTPLVLLPQTYGPFNKSRDRAARIVRGSRACWARDERSFEVLKKLLGSEFDPDRHRSGVDMAFGLVARKPPEATLKGFQEFASSDSDTMIGLNVSGLMYSDPEVTRSKYGFIADYAETIDRFVNWVMTETDARIVLVPHVMAPLTSAESDPAACEAVKRNADSEFQDRLMIAPTEVDQCEVKWLIAQCDWFCGTRMHATIAGLSTFTPTATVSYSDKALGVFESCGQGAEVFDPRKLDTETVVASMIDSYHRREASRTSLEARIPEVKAAAESQMDDIVEIIRDCDRPRKHGS